MSNEIPLNANSQTNNRENSDESLGIIQDTLQEFFSVADVSAVYDQPVQHGDTIVIPSAEVVSIMGFGVGSGPSNENGSTTGGGGGGGGTVVARPVAAIVITPYDVRVKPIVDVTKIALAGLTAAGFMLATLARMNSKRAPRF